jgi:hypothetical protein
MNVQSILLADVNQKSSWERIEGIATNRLGLQFPQNQGRWLIPDEETLNVSRTTTWKTMRSKGNKPSGRIFVRMRSPIAGSSMKVFLLLFFVVLADVR